MLYFIVNELSGKGKGKDTAQKIRAILEEKRIPYDMRATEYKAHATELAAELSRQPDCTGIVAVGGDGTFNEVLNGMDLSLPLGLISSGSGNDFMRVLAPGKTLEEQLDPILKGETRNIDYLTVNDKRSLNVAGTGFDVDILIRQEKFKKVLSGSFSYFASLLVTLLSLKFRRFTLNVDGKELSEDGVLLAMSNGRYFGGGLPVSPESQINDGVMDVLLIKKMPWYKIPGVLGKFLKGRIGEAADYAVIYHGARVTGSVTPAVAIQLDGELHEMPEFTCELHPAELTVFA